MTVLDTLKAHEQNQLRDWYKNDNKESRKFLKEIVAFTKENPNEIKQYCSQIIPTEFSSLSLVYEALSEHSTDFNTFLFEEIQRVILLAKNKRIKPEHLEILTDIETEDIYSKAQDIYVKIMEFMTSNLQLQNDTDFNIQLLDVIDYYLIDYDEDDAIPEYKNWINRIRELAENGKTSEKIKAREVLKDLDSMENLTSLSFFEKIKSLFS